MSDPTPDEALQYALSARSFLYALFGRLFSEEPSKLLLETLAGRDVQDSLTAFAKVCDPAAALEGLISEIVQECAKDRQTLLETLRSDHTFLFIGPGKLPAPPWESVYTSGQDVIFNARTLEVRNTYRQEGYLPTEYPKVADDHVAIELYFMQKLSARTLDDLMKNEEGALAECSRLLNVQHGFLSKHLAVWIPEFLRRIKKQERSGPFYPRVAECLSAYITWDMQTIPEIVVRLES